MTNIPYFEWHLPSPTGHHLKAHGIIVRRRLDVVVVIVTKFPVALQWTGCTMARSDDTKWRKWQFEIKVKFKIANFRKFLLLGVTFEENQLNK